MDILLHHPGTDTARWITEIEQLLPQARVRVWQEGDTAPADYALVWKPPADLLRARPGLRAVFNIGAGVDVLLALIRKEPALLPPQVSLIRLDDAGMGIQMAQYVSHAVLRHFRRVDEYTNQQRTGQWQPLKPRRADQHIIGILGLGVLGTAIARCLLALGFPVRGWNRSGRSLEGVQSYQGQESLPQFLDGLQVLVNMLPLTEQTENILDKRLFAQLPQGAQLINVARGEHLVEQDLLEALETGQLAEATLDVFREEPLPANHPFWNHPRLTITPHVSALTLRSESLRQIAEKIRRLEQGLPVNGAVDLARGY